MRSGTNSHLDFCYSVDGMEDLIHLLTVVEWSSPKRGCNWQAITGTKGKLRSVRTKVKITRVYAGWRCNFSTAMHTNIDKNQHGVFSQHDFEIELVLELRKKKAR